MTDRSGSNTIFTQIICLWARLEDALRISVVGRIFRVMESIAMFNCLDTNGFRILAD